MSVVYIFLSAEQNIITRTLQIQSIKYTSLKWVFVFFVNFLNFFCHREKLLSIFSVSWSCHFFFFSKLIFSRKRFIHWTFEALLDYKIYCSFITCLHFPIVCQSFRLWSYTGRYHHLDSRSRAGMRSFGSRFGLRKD